MYLKVPADAAEWIKEYEKEISGLSADAEAQKLIDEYSLTEVCVPSQEPSSVGFMF